MPPRIATGRSGGKRYRTRSDGCEYGAGLGRLGRSADRRDVCSRAGIDAASGWRGACASGTHDQCEPAAGDGVCAERGPGRAEVRAGGSGCRISSSSRERRSTELWAGWIPGSGELRGSGVFGWRISEPGRRESGVLEPAISEPGRPRPELFRPGLIRPKLAGLERGRAGCL